MTPRDWNEIEKMLENVADKETVREILSKVAEGLEVNFRKPVKITQASGKSSGSVVLSGTGCGVIFIGLNSGGSCTPTVDGVSLGTFAYVSHPVEIEFTESFSVKNSTTNECKVTAVFY